MLSCHSTDFDEQMCRVFSYIYIFTNKQVEEQNTDRDVALYHEGVPIQGLVDLSAKWD